MGVLTSPLGIFALVLISLFLLGVLIIGSIEIFDHITYKRREKIKDKEREQRMKYNKGGKDD